MNSVRRVACLVNGSIDSAVAALLLKKRGYEVACVFLNNKYQNATEREIQAEKAENVARKLDLSFTTANLHDIHWQYYAHIVANQYKKNLLPDENVLFCQHILFGRLFEELTSVHGMDAVSSGHYARTSSADGIFSPLQSNQGNKLLRAMDLKHDQSFLLSQLVQHTLRKLYFPLGDINHEVTAKIVESSDLKSLLSQPEFTSKNTYVNKDLLLKDLEKEFSPKQGDLELLETGRSVGRHAGLHLYHVGDRIQRENKTFYVAYKDLQSGKISLVETKKHPALFCSSMFITLAHWNFETPYDFFEKQMMDSEFQLNSSKVKCVLTVGMNNEYCGNDHLILSSSERVWGVSPGQHCALYNGEECVGGATVLKPGASEYAMNYGQHKKSVQKDSLFTRMKRAFLF